MSDKEKWLKFLKQYVPKDRLKGFEEYQKSKSVLLIMAELLMECSYEKNNTD